MEFHDGKPVTVEDLKFTLDFLMKYDRGFFWTANQYLERCEIKDAAARTVTLHFKEPYGAFEDRKSDVQGKSVSVRVDLGGRRIIKKISTSNSNKETQHHHNH